MKVQEISPGAYSISSAKYVLSLAPGLGAAQLNLKHSSQCYRFFAGGDCLTVGGREDCSRIGAWRILTQNDREVVFCREFSSNLWEKKQFLLVCRPGCLEFQHILQGRGQLQEVRFFRGRYQGFEYGFAGEFDEIYNTAPNFQERRYYHPIEHLEISNGNCLESWAGGQALASPCHCLGLRDRREERFLVAGLAAEPGQYRWDAFSWNPETDSPTGYAGDARLGGGFAALYHGKQMVNGEWHSPRLLLTLAETEQEVLPAYLRQCYRRGYLPRPRARRGASWWKSPIYCTWHDQVALACRDSVDYLSGSMPSAVDFCTQALTEEWLQELCRHDCQPGIVILDAVWQCNKNAADPDPVKWPDLRGWIESCHRRGIRVFLWNNAWDKEGLPADECITRDGVPLCADITNPKYERRFREMLRRYFSAGADGLNADGLKLDGSLSLPTGPGLRNYADLWGLELQRYYLRVLYEESKKHKKDVCISTFVANPYLADCTDMVRIADMYTTRLTAERAMLHRAQVYRQTMPGCVIDTDGQMHFYQLDDYSRILAAQAEVGVPCLYNAKWLRRAHFFQPAEFSQLTEADYRFFAKVFREWRRKNNL